MGQQRKTAKEKRGSCFFYFRSYYSNAPSFKRTVVSASPYCGKYIGGYPNEFNPKFLGEPRYDKYEIIYNTLRFDYEKVRDLLYQPEDSLMVTVLREPVSHFLSVYYYYYDKFASAELFTSRGHSSECWGSPFYPYLKHVHVTPDEYLKKLLDLGEQDDVGGDDVPYKFRGQNFQVSSNVKI